MKILFLTPPYSVKERYGNKVNLNKGYLPPLGLAYIASVLEQDKHKIKILDLQVYDLSSKKLLNEISRFNPDVIGVSSLTPTSSKAFKLAKFIKNNFKKTLIFGGPHVSCFPKETMEKNDFIDILVIGEGEYAMKEVLNCLENKKSLSKVKGIVYRTKNKIHFTGKRKIIENLDELPIPNRKYFDMKKYIPLPNQYKVLPITNMITSRGCSYGQCTYCFEAGRLGHKYRRISPKRAIEEIRYLQKTYGTREISFWDDEFVYVGKWVEDFCNLLIKEKINIKWSCYARVNYVKKDLLKKMAKAGCWNIFFGLESGNQELLNKIRKGITLKQIRKAVKWANESGIETRGSFMFALPGETPEMGEKTINFAISLDLNYAQFLLTTPFPGTKLLEQCEKEGRLSLDYDKYSVFQPVFIPFGYKNKEQLVKILKRAYRRFYLRPKYILKHLKKIKSWEDIKKYISGAKFVLGMS